MTCAQVLRVFVAVCSALEMPGVTAKTSRRYCRIIGPHPPSTLIAPKAHMQATKAALKAHMQATAPKADMQATAPKAHMQATAPKAHMQATKQRLAKAHM